MSSPEPLSLLMSASLVEKKTFVQSEEQPS